MVNGIEGFRKIGINSQATKLVKFRRFEENKLTFHKTMLFFIYELTEARSQVVDISLEDFGAREEKKDRRVFPS